MLPCERVQLDVQGGSAKKSFQCSIKQQICLKARVDVTLTRKILFYDDQICTSQDGANV